MSLFTRVHRTTPEDDLVSLSRHYYGSDQYALTIYQHNLDVLSNPNDVGPGIDLVIPHIHQVTDLLCS